ncbi:MAG: N-acetylmuramoyl-L-alanine amidase [Lachnospiraceae bacterium]|nr:N-acetylmuramoyl-L-alanine amidase [Lachnospiraceae bacterium]
MDMNYLVQRKINARKAYRRKVIATIALSAILLVLIVVGLIKIIADEKKAEDANKGTNVSENITPGLNGNNSGSAGENNTDASDNESTPAPAEPSAIATPTPTPVPKKKVAIDAGHGGNKDFGSSRPNEKQYEKDANLAIALVLKEELLQRGYDVYMIREADVAVENKERPILAKDNGADIYVSIHLNSLDEDSDATRGAETLYSNLLNEESSVLAQYVIDELTKVIDTRNRGIKQRDGLVVLNSNELPACLVECGFMSSATERAKLFDAEYQQKIAEGIANGIEKFLPLE